MEATKKICKLFMNFSYFLNIGKSTFRKIHHRFVTLEITFGGCRDGESEAIESKLSEAMQIGRKMITL